MMKNLIEFRALNPAIEKHCPILPASKCVPDWYRDLSLYTEGISKCPVMRHLEGEYGSGLSEKPVYTIKGCMPVFDYMNTGYIIPWTNEVLFKKTHSDIDPTKSSFRFHCNDRSYIEEHIPSRMPLLNTHFFTVNTGWTIKTPKGYSCLFFQPFYHFENRYAMLPAVLDTDNYHSPNFVGYMLADEFKVNPKDPLICAMPFKREEYKSVIKKEDSDNPTYHKNMIYGLLFKNRYRLFGWNKKKYE